MVRVAYDHPSVENTELFQTYARTSPQLYSSILTTDKYLLRYASNIWNIQFPNCTFHPPTNSIHLPLQFTDPNGGNTFYLDFPYQKITSNALSFSNQYLNPLTNTITLESLCEVYYLAENIIIRLIPESHIFNALNSRISVDGLTFSIPYLDIESHKIVDNLTKLSLSLKLGHGNNTLQELVMYPLQRFPPQPLSSGIFQNFANITPLQALQVTDDAIIEGIELSKHLIQFSSQYHHPMPQRNGSFQRNTNTDTDMSTSADVMGMLLSASGQGDDDIYDDYKIEDIDYTGGEGIGMHVEMVGGFNSTGVKRSRCESDDRLNNNNNGNGIRSKGIAQMKHKRMFSPGI